MPGFESLKILDFDHLELAVADLHQAAEGWHRLGFQKIAEGAIPERKLESHLLMQNGIAIVLSQSDLTSDPVARFVAAHGDGVLNIGLRCQDAVSAFEGAVNRGAEIVDPPKMITRDYGNVHQASIRAFGDVRHSFVSREGNIFLEGFGITPKAQNKGFGLTRIDHLVWALDAADLPRWTDYYTRIFGGLQPPIRMRAGEHREFLEVNHGPGIQKVAFATDDVVASARAVRKEGVKLVQVPSTYYAALPALQEKAVPLSESGILVDGTPEKYLLHTYTEATFAFELIERHGDEGFGEGSPALLCEALAKYKSRKGVIDQ